MLNHFPKSLQNGCLRMNKFVEAYIEFAQEVTDAPITFHNFMGYAVISAVVGRNVYFPFGDMNLYPNLYMLFIAASSRFRKSLD